MHVQNKDEQLLAVGVGLRSGVALFGSDGRLRWYRSQSFHNLPQLRRAAGRVLSASGTVSWLISEGEVSLAAVWERIAMRQGVRVQRVDNLTWRDCFRAQCGAGDAANSAQQLARQVIDWSGGPVPVVLHPNAASAILIGLWGVLQLGWLDAAPWQRSLAAAAPQPQVVR